jgi:hypothetical protein
MRDAKLSDSAEFTAEENASVQSIAVGVVVGRECRLSPQKRSIHPVARTSVSELRRPSGEWLYSARRGHEHQQ